MASLGDQDFLNLASILGKASAGRDWSRFIFEPSGDSGDTFWGAMGCTWSGLDALASAVGSGADVFVNKRRFRIQRQLGEGGFAFVYLVKEQVTEEDAKGQWKDAKDPSHASGALIATMLIVNSLRLCCILRTFFEQGL